MKETATVLKIQKNDVLLRFHEQESCHSCKSIFCKANERTFTAENPENLKLETGDVVGVYMKPGQTIGATFLLLIFPLLLFILLYFLAGKAFHIQTEIVRIGMGFSGIGLGFLISYIFSKNRVQKNMPRIVDILERNPGTKPYPEEKTPALAENR